MSYTNDQSNAVLEMLQRAGWKPPTSHSDMLLMDAEGVLEMVEARGYDRAITEVVGWMRTKAAKAREAAKRHFPSLESDNASRYAAWLDKDADALEKREHVGASDTNK